MRVRKSDLDRYRKQGLLLFSLLLVSVAPVPAATLFVDQGDPLCSDSSGTPFCTLRVAVARASLGDLVEVAAGTYNETVTTGWNITIRGASAETTIIDGGGQGRVFHLLHGATLERLTITGGNHPDSPGGGGIRSAGDTWVIDSVVTGNAAAGGGGIKQDGGTLQLLRTEVSNNTSDALHEAGGAGIWSSRGDLIIVDSRIVNNHNLHDGSPGGGIQFASHDGGAAMLIRTTVAGNTSRNNFGGMTFRGSSLTLIDSTVNDNEAAGRAGGIGAGGSSVTLINTTISGNKARTTAGLNLTTCCGGMVTLRNVTVYGNESSVSFSTGGAYFEGSTSVSSSILAGNTNADGASDCDGLLFSHGYNLVQSFECAIIGDTTGNLLGIDPGLLPLANNGGPTWTHALAAFSPARDAGNPALPGSSESACAQTDQRGFARPQDGDSDGTPVCDIGAFESGWIFGDGFESGDVSAWSVIP